MRKRNESERGMRERGMRRKEGHEKGSLAGIRTVCYLIEGEAFERIAAVVSVGVRVCVAVIVTVMVVRILVVTVITVIIIVTVIVVTTATVATVVINIPSNKKIIKTRTSCPCPNEYNDREIRKIGNRAQNIP